MSEGHMGTWSGSCKFSKSKIYELGLAQYLFGFTYNKDCVKSLDYAIPLI